MVLSEDNLLLLVDSYKMSHWVQYPPNTTNVYSYLESRGGRFQWNVFFGLQYLLKKYLQGNVVTQEKIDEAYAFSKVHFGTSFNTFNKEGWEYILKKYDGKLPLKIKAVPEGTILQNKNVLVTVENTDPKCYWLTNYIETLLVQVWYPITVATQSWHLREIIRKYLEDTGNPDILSFKLHDFGFRGVSSVETAGIGGMSHLVNFDGTDTIAGIIYANKYYNSGVCGFSVPASEHSTITSWGKENEVNAMRNMLEQYPKGIVACVSDSFDIFRACKEYWGDKLRYDVLKREGILVVRPDSGEPTEIVPKVLNILGDQFGFHTNEKGYKVLNPKVRVIQGDGIDFDTLPSILNVIKINGWSADNIAFGSGGGLLQKLNRDTMKFAFKCSNITVNGQDRDVFKSPITDPVKNSKKGRLKLINLVPSHGSFFNTVNENDNTFGNDQLETVFLNGDLTKEYSFDTIRKRVNDMSYFPAYLQYNFGLSS
jgi:nicotinamide phosphoribosyltransferase